MEGPIHEFQYTQNSNFLKEYTIAMNFEPHECVIFVQSTKICTCTHEHKAIRSIQTDHI